MFRDIAILFVILFAAIGSVFLPLGFVLLTSKGLPIGVNIILVSALIASITCSWLKIRDIYSENKKRAKTATIILVVLLATTWILSAYIWWVGLQLTTL
jgi:hypothetical protein